jgi:predicted nuclease of predicted toxin-antitoxin system
VRLKLDENLSRHLKPLLQSLGHDVSTVAEEGLVGQADSAIVAAAISEGRMLFTVDLGLADVRAYPPGSHPGIVVFRPGTGGPLAVNRFVEAFVRTADLTALARCVVVAEPGRARVRRPQA